MHTLQNAHTAQYTHCTTQVYYIKDTLHNTHTAQCTLHNATEAQCTPETVRIPDVTHKTMQCEAAECIGWCSGTCFLCASLDLCTVLPCITLHCTALHCTTLHCITLHCTALQRTPLQFSIMQCTALHCTALHCTFLCSPYLEYLNWFCSMRPRRYEICPSEISFFYAHNTSVHPALH